MKILFDNKSVVTPLTNAASIITSKSLYPVLESVVFDVRKESVFITASDSDTWIITKAPLIESDEEGKFCIKADDIVKALKPLGDVAVSMELSSDRTYVTVDYSKGKIKLPVFKADDYPVTKKVSDEPKKRVVESSRILAAIEKALFAAANDELRPILNGINFRFTSERMVCCATNGFKLIRYTDRSVKGDEYIDCQFTLPKKPASAIIPLLEQCEGNVTVDFDGSMLSVQCSTFKITTKMLEGTYPNAEYVIPKDNSIIVTLQTEDILGSLRRILPLGSKNALTKLVLSDNEIELSVDDIDFGRSAKEAFPCKYEGETFEIGLDGNLLTEVVKSVGSDTITMEMSTPKNPVIMYGEGTSKDDCLSLIVPMQY